MLQHHHAERDCCCTGMVADKHHVTAAQAAAMGMLSPAAGLRVMHSVLSHASNVQRCIFSAGVVGGASVTYWQQLLKAAKQRPALFDAVAPAEADAVHMVCTFLSLNAAVPQHEWRVRALIAAGIVDINVSDIHFYACSPQACVRLV